jgi:hypothetical protein
MLKRTFALVAVIAAVTVACGPAPSDPNDLQDLSVQINAPSSLSLSGATLSTPYGSSAVNGASGTVSLTLGGAAVASVGNANGTLLMGFVSATRKTLNARTTAEVLAFYALGGSFLEPAMQGSLIDFLARSDAVKPVADAVQTALQTSAPNISADQPGVKVALEAMLKALAPTRAPDSAVKAQNVTVSPDYQSSGVLVREVAPLNDAINVYNSFRRPVQVFVDRTSPTPGAVTNFALEGAAVETPDRAGTLQTMMGFAQGDVPRSAVRSQDIAVPGGDNDQSAIYTVTVVGAGGDTLTGGSISGDKVEKAKDLALRTAIERFLAPTVASALEAGAAQRTAGDITPILAGLSSATVTKIQTGDFVQGVNDAFRDLFASSALSNTVDAVLRVYYPNVRSRDGLANLRARLTRSLAALLGATASSVSVNGSGIIGTIRSSKRVELFNVVTKPITMRLTPQQTTLGKGGEAILTAAIRLPQGTDPSSVTYRYSVAGVGAGYATDAGTDKAFPFTTSSTTITYKHRDTINIVYGTDTVTVEALQNQPSGQVVIAKASASVTVNENTITVTPKTIDLALGDNQTFTATVNPLPSSGTLGYVFVTFGKSAFAGGAQTQVGSSNTVTFRQADDTVGNTQPVTVTVVRTDPATNAQTVLGQARAVVKVKEDPSLQNGDFSQNLQFWSLGGVGAALGSGARCVPAQNGNPFVYLNVYSNRVGSFSQSFKVPASAKTLSYRVWGNLDPVRVTVSLGGTTLDTFVPASTETLRDPQDPYSAYCNGTTDTTKRYDISSFAGKKVTLSISGTATGNNGTFANFDDFQVR